MAIFGKQFTKTFHLEANLKTTTSQYRAVSFVPGTSTVLDRTVGLCGNTGTAGSPTAASWHAIGINQSYLSATSEEADICLFGLSKVICAESVTAGDWIKAYDGISTTTMAGKISPMPNGLSATMATQSIASHSVVLGRALEDGTTNTVIEAFINPQKWDSNFK